MVDRNVLNGRQKLKLADWYRNAVKAYPTVSDRESLAKLATADLGFSVTVANVSAAARSVGVPIRSRNVQSDSEATLLDDWIRACRGKLEKEYVNRGRLAAQAQTALGFSVTPSNIYKSLARTGIKMAPGRIMTNTLPNGVRQAAVPVVHDNSDFTRELMERTKHIEAMLESLCASLGASVK